MVLALQATLLYSALFARFNRTSAQQEVIDTFSNKTGCNFTTNQWPDFDSPHWTFLIQSKGLNFEYLVSNFGMWAFICETDDVYTFLTRAIELLNFKRSIIENIPCPSNSQIAKDTSWPKFNDPAWHVLFERNKTYPMDWMLNCDLADFEGRPLTVVQYLKYTGQWYLEF